MIKFVEFENSEKELLFFLRGHILIKLAESARFTGSFIKRAFIDFSDYKFRELLYSHLCTAYF